MLNETAKKEVDYDPEELMDKNWLASRLGVKTSTITGWISKGYPMPNSIKLTDGPRAPRRWRRGVAEQWIIDRESAS